jgi:uncharacterized protein with PCYCGC motif
MGEYSSRQYPQSDTPRSRIGRRVVLVGGAAACAAAIGDLLLARDFSAAPHAYALAPEAILPPDIQRAPADVREAYRFAVANRDTLRYIPCYCGCVAKGYTSNASCYVKESSTSGNLDFDRMSLG